MLVRDGFCFRLLNKSQGLSKDRNKEKREVGKASLSFASIVVVEGREREISKWSCRVSNWGTPQARHGCAPGEATGTLE